MKNFIDKILSIADIKVTRNSTFKNLEEKASISETYSLLNKIKPNNLEIFIKNLTSSKSQIGQDLFVLNELDFKKKGFFVEFGATNGIDLSNSYLLEKNFNWDGILAEPAKKWHREIKKNRTAFIEKKCVWHSSNESLNFNQVNIGEFSTIDAFTLSDMHNKIRKKGKKYKVTSISLNDLLDKYNAPKIIDYLSIDTEGSEYEILSNFDFTKYKFRVITCEHNFTELREKIYRLLKKNGYERKFTDISKFDDWYIAKEKI